VKPSKQSPETTKLQVNVKKHTTNDSMYGYQQWNVGKKNKLRLRKDR
jgi:hypothetical protein